MRKKIIVGVLFLLFICLSLINANQSGTIKGIIKNNSGKILQDTEILLINVKTKSQVKVKSQKDGSYIFKNIPYGKYLLTVEKKGYQKLKRAIDLNKEKLTINLILKTKVLAQYKREESQGVVGEERELCGIPPAGVLKPGARKIGKVRAIYHPNRIKNTEEYVKHKESGFFNPKDEPLSTFSLDVDTASYGNIRRFLQNLRRLPIKDAVRTEEVLNYFNYNYPLPPKGEKFSFCFETGKCLWSKNRYLVQIGIRAQEIEADKTKGNNFVFLIDVSGSMNSPLKLDLLKSSLKLMVDKLDKDDKVSIVVYAGSAGLVLPATKVSQKSKIIDALDKLTAGGSTAGGAGIQLAYKVAKENYIKGGNNRVILATDGDFNVGVSSTSSLERLIEEKRKDGIFLTVLGFGMGNYKDSRLETIADKGNGTYHYIDSVLEGKKVFVTDLRSTLFTVAKDVKVQVEFNPSKIKAYRLVGYDNRVMENKDFKDDKKDAAELGSGHRVIVFYELILSDSKEEIFKGDKLKYQKNRKIVPSKEWFTLKLRYKEPQADKSKEIVKTYTPKNYKDFSKNSNDFKFASVLAAWSQLLKDSPYKGKVTYDELLKIARECKGKDYFGYRAEFIKLLELSDIYSKKKE